MAARLQRRLWRLGTKTPVPLLALLWERWESAASLQAGSAGGCCCWGGAKGPELLWPCAQCSGEGIMKSCSACSVQHTEWRLSRRQQAGYMLAHLLPGGLPEGSCS